MAFIDKENIKEEMNMPYATSTWDTMFNTLITAILSIWDEMTGRTWASTEHTEYYNADEYQDILFLKNAPVSSSADFTMYDDPDWEWTSDDLVDTDEYRVDYVNGIVYKDASFCKGKQSIKVTYTAGYADADCPGWLKELLIRQVCVWYKQGKDNAWHIDNISQPGGGGTALSMLKNNLLPEFHLMAETHVRQSVA